MNIVYSPKSLPSKINIFEIRVGKNIEPSHLKKKNSEQAPGSYVFVYTAIKHKDMERS